jgi:hypothetical protein
MPSAKSLAFLALLVAAPSPALVAQDKDQLCNDIQRRPMRLGQWASYNWTGGRAEGTTMRMAIVGTEPVEGTPYHWYEMMITDPAKGAKGKTIIQMLVPGLGYQAGGVRGMIMKNGDQDAMRMPDQMVRMMGGRMGGQNFAAEIARRCQEMELVGWEQVTVPAGTFRALHIKSPAEQTEAWVLPDFYFGLLKATMKDGSSMVLTGRGTDAKSSITETPRVMPH